MRRIPQEEWDRRAAKLNIEWLEEVQTDRIPVDAKCLTCGYVWKKRPDKVKQGKGCPNCAGHIVTQDEWDKRAAAVGLEWTEPVQAATGKVNARCLKCGHEEPKSPNGVTAGSGCPKCAGKRKTQKDWDREAKERGFEWTAPVIRSHDHVAARCLTCGYEWQLKPTNKTGCPVCKKVARVTPEQWHERAAAVGIEWLEEPKHALSPTAARCLSCDYQYIARPGNVTNGRGCLICSREASGLKRRISDEEKLELAASKGIKWLDGTDFRMDNQTPAECLTCGYQWQAWPQSVKAGNGCPHCIGKVTTPKDWEERAAKKDLKWLEPVKTSGTKTKAQCLKCKFIWNAMPSSVAAGSGCPKCADYGLNHGKPTTLYLLVRDDGVAKVGVTNKGSGEKARMKRLGKLGYKVKMTWDFELGSEAFAVERAIIYQWRNDDQLLPAADRGEDGWTETVHTDSLSLYEISRRINDLIGTT